MIIQKRRQAFLYLSLAIVGVILLGVSLPGLRFQAGLPIPGADPVSINAAEIAPGSPETASPSLLPYGLALGIILLFFALISALLRKVNIKRLIFLAGALALLFVFFSLLPTLAPDQPTLNSDNQGVAPPLSVEYLIAPIGEPPAHLSFCVIAGLLIACAIMIAWFVSHAFQRVKKENKLAAEAESAVQAIGEGQNLRDVIIYYYLKMERVIAQERGIERGLSVTPREFETYLVEKGIPRGPVLQLTFLFEKARYGNQSLNEQDKQDAVNSFLAIRLACQPERPGIQ